MTNAEIARSPRTRRLALTAALALGASWAAPVAAADYPEPVEGSFVIEDFAFHTGETIPEMVVHYRTVGDPEGEPVLIVHGSTGTGESLLKEGFAGELFGPGQALDAEKYYIILPDAIGMGGSSKPSDGMRAEFPRYNYADMIEAQHALVTEHLGIDHLRLVMGDSMGGMVTWLWGTTYPDFMDALVPMASLPGPMSGRNWMMRRMVIDAVRSDPAWNEGDYEEQPPKLREQSAWFGLATTGGNQRLQEIGASREAADAFVDDKLANQTVGDANDTMYRWDASRDYDPSADLGRIEAAVLAINSEDDERNPPELGVMEAGLARIPGSQAYIIPASPETMGHSTTGSMAQLYEPQLKAFLEGLPE